MAASIEILPVDLADRRQVKRFIKFHFRIYRDDKYWVAPLTIDYLERLNPKKNPYFHHSKVQPFLAIRDGEIVGRITAHENNRHVAFHNESVGFFGYFETIDDVSVAEALFGAAGKWLSERGVERMRGPASFSVNGDPVGLLVDGFDSTPIIGTSYNPAYYERLITNAGFTTIQDFFAHYSEVRKTVSDRVERIAKRAMKDPKLVVRRPDMKNYMQEIEKLKFIYNQALSRNWGAVPMTDEEFRHFSKDLKLAVDPEVSFVAEYDGEPVGICLVFVDLNRALQAAKGRLLPFGLLKILAKKRSITWVRMPVLGVLERYRMKGIDAVFYYKSMIAAYKRGYRHGELSWILESNQMMRRILENLGMHVYKTYRVYEKPVR